MRHWTDCPEYDIRRPMTPTASNLLGLVKHVTGVELGYLGDCVGRPSPVRLPWVEDKSIWESADMWARAEESRDELIALYRIEPVPLESRSAWSDR